jgi:hypothetical protein
LRLSGRFERPVYPLPSGFIVMKVAMSGETRTCFPTNSTIKSVWNEIELEYQFCTCFILIIMQLAHTSFFLSLLLRLECFLNRLDLLGDG